MKRMCINPLRPLKGELRTSVQSLEVLLSCSVWELLMIKEKMLMWKKYSLALY